MPGNEAENVDDSPQNIQAAQNISHGTGGVVSTELGGHHISHGTGEAVSAELGGQPPSLSVAHEHSKPELLHSESSNADTMRSSQTAGGTPSSQTPQASVNADPLMSLFGMCFCIR